MADAPDAVPVGCSRPFRTKSGEYVRCQSRLKSKCPSCAELYRGDWAAIARSGIFDADPLAFRFYLLTLTAPSFGAVHRVPKHEGAKVRRCACGVLHSVADAELRGVPLDVAGYDYAGAVAWNRDSGVLWDNTRRRLRDHFAGVEFFVVREWQDRGALHLHALVRIPIAGAPTDRMLGELARSAVAFSKIDGSEVAWGSQFQCDAFRADGAGAKAIWYLSKALNYVLKDTAREAGGSASWQHVARLQAAARLMRCSRGCEPESCVSRTHHRFGARGHVVSNTRQTKTHAGWSMTGLTRRAQRLARVAWFLSREAARQSEAAREASAAPEHIAAALSGVAGRLQLELRSVAPVVP
jgi:hypothetical protein